MRTWKYAGSVQIEQRLDGHECKRISYRSGGDRIEVTATINTNDWLIAVGNGKWKNLADSNATCIQQVAVLLGFN